MANPVFQSGLGNVSQVTRQDQNMFGYFMLAKVLKVHEKHNTVDVKLLRNNNRIIGSSNNEGRFACRVLTSNAGYDSTNRIYYGIQEPLFKGQTVVVTFLDGMKDEPIVIGVIHDVDNPNNILPSKYPLDPTNDYEDLKDTRKFLRVFPLQDYFKLDGVGNLEFSLHSKSFISWSKGVTDDANGTDFEDLSEKSKVLNKTLQLPDNFQDEFGNAIEVYTEPKSLLIVFRDDIDDNISTKTKIFVDMNDDKGTLRLSRDNKDNTLSYIEMSKDGSIKLKRQIDSNVRDSGSNYSDIIVSPNGDITIGNSSGASMAIQEGTINLTGNILANGKEVLTQE